MGMIQAPFIYCALYVCYCDIRSTSDQQALDPRGLQPLVQRVAVTFVSAGSGSEVTGLNQTDFKGAQDCLGETLLKKVWIQGRVKKIIPFHFLSSFPTPVSPLLSLTTTLHFPLSNEYEIKINLIKSNCVDKGNHKGQESTCEGSQDNPSMPPEG